jgi:hypothetical protein
MLQLTRVEWSQIEPYDTGKRPRWNHGSIAPSYVCPEPLQDQTDDTLDFHKMKFSPGTTHLLNEWEGENA